MPKIDCKVVIAITSTLTGHPARQLIWRADFLNIDGLLKPTSTSAEFNFPEGNVPSASSPQPTCGRLSKDMLMIHFQQLLDSM